ncbi:MAG: hypothetical protein IJB36_06500 [Clostridia bacterium]|nr:hypothetical protein [Clostridia bacterium]
MSLIKCSECGKEISDFASKCPNCGFNTKEYRNNKKQAEKNPDSLENTWTKISKIMIIAFIIIFAVLIIIALNKDDPSCSVCNGSGYYEKKTCPVCDGTGYSDYEPSDSFREVWL